MRPPDDSWLFGNWHSALSFLVMAARSICAREGNDQFPARVLRPADWSGLFRLAMRNELLPVLYPLMSSTGELDDDARRFLLASMVKTTAKNRLFKDELIGLISAMNETGIIPLPLKGIRMAERLYGDWRMRTMHDLDILVERMQVPTALEILRCKGYHSIDHEPMKMGKHRVMERTLNSNVTLQVELHGDISSPQAIRILSVRSLASGIQMETWEGCTVKSFDDCGELCYLIHHFFESLSLKTLLDLGRKIALTETLQDGIRISQVLGTGGLLPFGKAAIHWATQLFGLKLDGSGLETMGGLCSDAEPISVEEAVQNVRRVTGDLLWFPSGSGREALHKDWLRLKLSADFPTAVQWLWGRLWPEDGLIRQRYKLAPDTGFAKLLSYRGRRWADGFWRLLE